MVANKLSNFLLAHILDFALLSFLSISILTVAFICVFCISSNIRIDRLQNIKHVFVCATALQRFLDRYVNECLPFATIAVG